MQIIAVFHVITQFKIVQGHLLADILTNIFIVLKGNPLSLEKVSHKLHSIIPIPSIFRRILYRKEFMAN